MYRHRSFRPRQGRRNGHFRPRSFRRVKTIDPRFFVQRATGEVEETYQPQYAFSDFRVDPRLGENIISRGYSCPTPIQDQTIPPLLAGRDVVGIASTGTGKTAAFLIPLIDKVVKDSSQKVLIITPTRELATQIEKEFRSLAGRLNLYSALCIGGVAMGPQIRNLSRNPQFVIGTPGRLEDLERQKRLFFGAFKTIVLDEVDRMLDMGFVEEVSYIILKLPSPRQSLFFSATLSDKVRAVMQAFLHDPVMISIKGGRPSANVDQDVVKLNGQQKIDVLHNLLVQDGFNKVLVFGRTKWGIEKLFVALSQRGFRVASIHGNKSQNQRQRALEEFKANRVQVLLATDVASRGLDIDDVTHVINFDQPESYEDYIHRVGRTGRADKKGVALTFVD